MTDLSPAAQAVLSAWAKPVDVDRSLVINGQALEFQARGALAAALRAAADQVVPTEMDLPPIAPDLGHFRQHERRLTRQRLLAIAAELEGNDA
jgi:hypothetical protein